MTEANWEEDRAQQPEGWRVSNDGLHREAYAQALRDVFRPALRRLGFKGTERHFVRTQGESVQCVLLVASRAAHGRQVNLGLNYRFLPARDGSKPLPADDWQEPFCAWRWRLEPDREACWRYGVSADESYRTVTEMTQAFIERAEPELRTFADPARLLREYVPADLATLLVAYSRWHILNTELALRFAQIHRHLGQPEDARRWAEAGLACVGGASLVEQQLQEVLLIK